MAGNETLVPQKGDVVSFSYKGFTPAGIPVDPQLVSIRTDLDWQDVLQNHVQDLAMNGAILLFT